MKHHQQHHWGSIMLEDDKLNIFQRIFVLASFVAILVFIFPSLAVAQTTQEEPFVFPVQNLAPVKIVYQSLPEADFIWEEQPANKARAAKLQNYLASNGSPMAEYAEALINKEHYVFIIAISFAESNYCKVQIRENNCWGIGGSRPETYPSIPAAFDRADGLIQRYRDLGMTNAKLMRNSWVGWENDSWIVAVNQEITRLAALEL